MTVCFKFCLRMSQNVKVLKEGVFSLMILLNFCFKQKLSFSKLLKSLNLGMICYYRTYDPPRGLRHSFSNFLFG